MLSLFPISLLTNQDRDEAIAQTAKIIQRAPSKASATSQAPSHPSQPPLPLPLPLPQPEQQTTPTVPAATTTSGVMNEPVPLSYDYVEYNDRDTVFGKTIHSPASNANHGSRNFHDGAT